MDFKKSRTIFSPHQLSILENSYSDNAFPKSKERQQIADQLGIRLLLVQVWFQNKRAKEKRKQKKQALVSSKIFIPKPPSFWPNNIPFNTKITDLLKQNTETFPASSSSSVSSCLLKPSLQSVTACPTTMASLSELPVTTYDLFPLPDQPSSLDVSASGYSMHLGLQSSKESLANMYQPRLDFETSQRGLVLKSSNCGSDYLHHMDKSLHYCSDAYTFNLEDRHLVNVPFGAMRHNSTSTSSVSMMPVNDSLNPVVLDLMTQSTHIESTNCTAIESPIHSRHAFTGGELPEIGSSHSDFFADNSSTEFLTSQHCQKYYYSNDDHIGHMTEQQVMRHSEKAQSYSDITRCLTSVEATSCTNVTMRQYHTQ